MSFRPLAGMSIIFTGPGGRTRQTWFPSPCGDEYNHCTNLALTSLPRFPSPCGDEYSRFVSDYARTRCFSGFNHRIIKQVRTNLLFQDLHPAHSERGLYSYA